MNKLLLFSVLLLLSSNAFAQNERIVSVGGVITEIVFALGAGENVVAVDTSSTHPVATEDLPKVGYHRTLSAEGLLSLHPDLIIISDAAGPPTAITQLKQANEKILEVPSPQSIQELLVCVRRLGQALEKEAEAEQLISRLESELNALKSINTQKQPTVMFIMQHGNAAPLVAGTDTNADRMISLLGAKNSVLSYSGYKPLTPEAAVLLSPDFIITTADKDTILSLPGISSSSAAKNNRIVSVDTLTFLGFGPRSLQLAKELKQRMNHL